MTPTPTILLFFKAPRPGFVKTRLAKNLGQETACHIYKHLATATLSIIPQGWSKTVYYTPNDARSEMKHWLGEDITLQAQSEGDLGDRLSSACKDAFEAGASSVILLGGDCPDIQTEQLHLTSQYLAKNQPVIGPAMDGGYWLLGLPSHTPEIFQKITWSGDSVFQDTLQRFSDLKQKPHELDTLEDVDDLPSWSRALQNDPSLLKLV